MLAAVASRQGVVFIFRRIQNVWSLMTTLQAPLQDFFATSVDMSHDGRTLKVNSFPTGRAHVFVRPADTWQYATSLAPFGRRGEICQNSRLSGDGKTLVFTCTAPPRWIE